MLLKVYRTCGAVCPRFSVGGRFIYIGGMIFDEIVNDAYEEREYPALLALAHEWSGTRPFRALRLLVATPVFRNTLLEYRALIAGGADLVVGVAGLDSGEEGAGADASNAGAEMPCDPGIVEVLRGNGIPVIGVQEALKMEAAGCGFDLILDCAGQFSACHPRFGFVELTRSGVQFYENTSGRGKATCAHSLSSGTIFVQIRVLTAPARSLSCSGAARWGRVSYCNCCAPEQACMW